VGLQDVRYSYATAVGLFQSVVGILLLLIANFIAKKLGEEGIL
jgi:putative aldouronate transport system permease protein